MAGWFSSHGTRRNARTNGEEWHHLGGMIPATAEAAGIRWHGWHGFRRGLASNLNRLGMDDSVIQANLRHSNAEVHASLLDQDGKSGRRRSHAQVCGEPSLCGISFSTRSRKRGFGAGRDDPMTCLPVSKLLVRNGLAEREGFEPSIQVLARITV